MGCALSGSFCTCWSLKILGLWMIHIFLNRLYVLEQFQGHSKTEWEVQGVPICLPPSPQNTQPPHNLHLSQALYVWYNWWTNIDTSSSTEVHSLHWGSLCEMYSTGLDKCIITCIHHYMYPPLQYHAEWFNYPKSPLGSTHSFVPHHRRVIITDLLIVSTVLPFQDFV